MDQDPNDASRYVCIVCKKPSADGSSRNFYESKQIGKYFGNIHEAVKELDVPEAGDVDGALAGEMREPLDDILPPTGGPFGALPLEEDPVPPAPKPPRKNSNAYMLQAAREELGEDATEDEITSRVNDMKERRKVEVANKKQQRLRKMFPEINGQLKRVVKQVAIQKKKIASETVAKNSAKRALEWLLEKINREGCNADSRDRLEAEMWDACAEMSDTESVVSASDEEEGEEEEEEEEDEYD